MAIPDSSINQEPEGSIKLSPSVTQVRDTLADRLVSASELASRLCEFHHDYYQSKFGEAAPTLSRLRTPRQRTSDDWLGEIRRLIDLRIIDYLDTAAVALGLGLIDGRIFGVFHKLGIIDALIEDLANKIPNDTGRRSEDHQSAAEVSVENHQAEANAEAGPPYKCAKTIGPGICLKFYRNPENGLYDLPPGGERVNCEACLYFFE
jgi:hypothetical protein